jgi:hypothetical protein
MAKRGTVKQSSLDQENYVARLYNGMRSPSSGAAVTDAGDVRTRYTLIECKTTGGPGRDKEIRLPGFIHQLTKASEEAWEEGRSPALALRYYAPDHKLSNQDGWLDVVVRPMADDSELALAAEIEKDKNEAIH